MAVGQYVMYSSYRFAIRTIDGTTITMTPTDGISFYRFTGGEQSYNNIETLLNNACIRIFASYSKKNQLTIRSVKRNEFGTNLVVEPSSSGNEYWWVAQLSMSDSDGVTHYGCGYNKIGDDKSWLMYLYSSNGKTWSPAKRLFPVVTFNKSLLVGRGDGWSLQ